MQTDEKNNIESKTTNIDKAFLIDILTDLETLKNLIFNGSDVPAYRNVQKISDKIKEKIRSL